MSSLIYTAFRFVFAVMVIFASALGLSAAVDPPRDTSVSPKPARSQFDIREFRDFINYDLSVPQPRGELQIEGREIRTVQGRVVDHSGAPIAGALVALATEIGQHWHDFNENFDKTDELGRFLVLGESERNRIVVRCGAGQVWNGYLDDDQNTIQIVWPAPATLHLKIDPALCPPNAGVTIGSTEYWAGMEPLRREAKLDAEGAATVESMLPGTYSAYRIRPLVTASGGKEYSGQEFGRFTIRAGEEKHVLFDPSSMIPVHGDIGFGETCVLVERVKLRYRECVEHVDGVLCEEDGKFLAHVPGPGVYCLTAKSVPVPRANNNQSGTPNVNRTILKHYFVVGDETRSVTLELPEEKDPTVEFVHSWLDAEEPDQGNVVHSWSYSDWQVAQLVRHKDRDGVARELLQIVNDRFSPFDWRYLAIEALGGMTETPGVVDGLLALVDLPADRLPRGAVVSALRENDTDVEKVVGRLLPLADDEDRRTRWGVQYCLGRIALGHPEVREKIIPVFIRTLGDPWHKNRSQAAGFLGMLGAKQSASELTELFDDPSYAARLQAARALSKLNDDQAPLVRTAMALLSKDNADYEAQKDAALALNEVKDLPPETIELLEELSQYDGRPPFDDHQKLMRHQLSTVARDILEKASSK